MSSFANTDGGDVLLGVREDHGVPKEITGLDGVADNEMLRLQNLVTDGLEPHVVGIEMRPIQLASGKFAVVIRIPRSWTEPHMIVFEQWNRFYGRHSTGKYIMDVSEIRDSFVGVASRVDRIRRFRSDRASRISEGDAPQQVTGPKLILHLVPLDAFDPSKRYDVKPLESDPRLKPLGVGLPGYNCRYNIDGFLTISSGDGQVFAFLQVYTNGVFESVDSSLLFDPSGRNLIYGETIEREVIAAMRRFRSAQRELGSTAPVVVMLTAAGVLGRTIVGSRGPTPWQHSIDRSVLSLPEVVLDDVTAETLEPMLDDLWRASGWPRSPILPAHRALT